MALHIFNMSLLSCNVCSSKHLRIVSLITTADLTCSCFQMLSSMKWVEYVHTVKSFIFLYTLMADFY